uniref:Uncharacterized protein n=1 Tax=Anguilla anguilla TaxID=7936 RepID=A0A0E9VC74_ANGAN
MKDNSDVMMNSLSSIWLNLLF